MCVSRQSQGLHILQVETRCTQAAKMECSEFGTAILVNVSVSSTLVLKFVLWFNKALGFSLACQILLRYWVFHVVDNCDCVFHIWCLHFTNIPDFEGLEHSKSGAEFRLDGPVGQVYAMIFDKNILFAGTQVTYYYKFPSFWSFYNRSD